MATIYSLVCWGGRLGKTVSLSASTDVVTLTAHGLRDGTKLWPSGTLPAELNASTPVYARSTAPNTFTLHASAEGAIAGTDQILFAGTSTYAAVVLKSDLVANPSAALSPYGLSDLSRWGDNIFDSLSSFNSGRQSSTQFDEEVCEIGEAFSEIRTSAVTISVPCASITITSRINGVFSDAFHFGVIDSGYILGGTASSQISSLNYNFVLEGIQISGTAIAAGGLPGMRQGTICTKLILKGFGATSTGSGITNLSALSVVDGCLITGFKQGLLIYQYASGMQIRNNTIVKNNTYGITTYSSVTTHIYGFFYNNICVGNVTNWFTQAASLEGCSCNSGESGDTNPPWTTTGGTILTVNTTDFVDYANNDFRPALSTSPQVDSGVLTYKAFGEDLAGNERPNYNNGGAEAVDIGCYEYDHGYGNHPASTTVTFYGVVAGSEIHVYDSEDNELVGTESCTANQSLTWGIPTNPNVKITIIKRGLRWMKFTYLSEEGLQTIPIFPQPDLGYNNPA